MKNGWFIFDTSHVTLYLYDPFIFSVHCLCVIMILLLMKTRPNRTRAECHHTPDRDAETKIENLTTKIEELTAVRARLNA